jgi:hypothetical protein
MMKTCKGCGQNKPLDQFHPAPACRDGHRAKCKTCTNAQMAEHRGRPEVRRRLKGYFARPEVRDRQNAARKSPEGRESYRRRASASPGFALSFSLYRALKRRPTEGAVTHRELMELYQAQRGRCALSGLQMTWMKGKIVPTSLSVDRIDSALGYTRANVRLVCHAANRMRGDSTDAQMLQMAQAIVEHLVPGELHPPALCYLSFGA